MAIGTSVSTNNPAVWAIDRGAPLRCDTAAHTSRNAAMKTGSATTSPAVFVTDASVSRAGACRNQAKLTVATTTTPHTHPDAAGAVGSAGRRANGTACPPG